jgi:hypothetical protein
VVQAQVLLSPRSQSECAAMLPCSMVSSPIAVEGLRQVGQSLNQATSPPRFKHAQPSQLPIATLSY